MAEHPLDAYAGCWALVTGSARREGLGFAFARELASRRINIALVDILGEELEQRAAELRSSYGISVRTVATDLACLESIAAL
jgi:uncharacterized protein